MAFYGEGLVAQNNGSFLVVNKGEREGVVKGQKVVLYRIGEEIKDPITGESLGKVEIILGKGIVEHVQEKICTVRTQQELVSGTSLLTNYSVFSNLKPFDGVKVQDSVRFPNEKRFSI